MSFMASFFPSLLLSPCRRIHDICEYLQIGQIFNTLEGVLSTEQGVYIAEVVMDRNVKGARGRFKMYDDDEVPPLLPSSLTLSLSLSLFEKFRFAAEFWMHHSFTQGIF
jgi:hypothetical protein